jgi:hypothetical protein
MLEKLRTTLLQSNLGVAGGQNSCRAAANASLMLPRDSRD